MKNFIALVLSLIAIATSFTLLASLTGLPIPSFTGDGEDLLALFAAAAVALVALNEYSRPRRSLTAINSTVARKADLVVFPTAAARTDRIAA